VFQTTFDDTNFPTRRAPGVHWDHTVDPHTDAAIGQTGDGVGPHGDWVSSNGNGDQILTAANYSGGGGGKGFRHFRGDGANNGGGGLNITLPSPVTEMWVRFYMRYQSGFAWTPAGQPVYTKDHYWSVGGNYLIYGIQGGHSWGLTYIGSSNHSSSLTWAASQGGNTGDGQWHYHEYHAKQNGANGVLEIWIDGVQVLNDTGVNLGSSPWSRFALGENQETVTGAGGSDYFTDYDDIAISTTGRIGPIGTILPAAPRNLRVQ
jgi:hypothetical protein